MPLPTDCSQRTTYRIRVNPPNQLNPRSIPAHGTGTSDLGPVSEETLTNVVEIDGVTKRFDEFVAVSNLSFNVRQGSIFGLLGPNGAGKTTTIRMIVNIFAPDTGEIRILGNPVSPAAQQRIGYLPEERGLYKKMKVGEQLLFFAALKGLSAEVASPRMDDWLLKLDLSRWKQKRSMELSKGMQQKV